MPPKDWETAASSMLRGLMERRGLSFADLADLLANLGVAESDAKLRTKIARGRFTAKFFLQCIAAMGIERLDLSGWI